MSDDQRSKMKAVFDKAIEAGLGPSSLVAAALTSLKISLDELGGRVSTLEAAGDGEADR